MGHTMQMLFPLSRILGSLFCSPVGSLAVSESCSEGWCVVGLRTTRSHPREPYLFKLESACVPVRKIGRKKLTDVVIEADQRTAEFWGTGKVSQ
jgi:hypothetical protein